MPYALDEDEFGTNPRATAASRGAEDFEPIESAGSNGRPPPASAQWAEPAATGIAHGSTPHLRLEDREREPDPDAVFLLALGGSADGIGAGAAE